MRKTTIALGTAATLALAAGSLAYPAFADEKPAAAPIAQVQAPSLQPTAYDPNRSLAPLVQAVEPAVVAIEVEGSRETRVPPMLRQFMDVPERRSVKGEGSGFVIRADGLLVTNHHVIDSADTITARFADGRRVQATLIGSDPENDVALLQLPGDEPWPFVELGDSDEAEVGDWVVAVGNPLGLGTTVTTGIISGKGRNFGNNPFHAFLQTDAAINQGNSGGPLFGLDGRVVGMNTAIIQYANTVGFAVPSTTLKRIIEDLEDDGAVQRGFIGVALQPVDGDLAVALGLDSAHGALVTGVQPGLPGEKAGLSRGDVIVRVNDAAMRDVGEVIRTIGAQRPGDRVTLGIVREGRDKNIAVQLAERTNTQAKVTPVNQPPAGATDQLERLGVRLRPGSASRAEGGGVQVLAVDANGAARDKLQRGDRIVSANRVPIGEASDLIDVLKGSGRMVLLEVLRGEGRSFVAVPLPAASK